MYIYIYTHTHTHTHTHTYIYICIYVYVRHASTMDFERAGVQTLEKGQNNIKRKKMNISHILVISF